MDGFLRIATRRLLASLAIAGALTGSVRGEVARTSVQPTAPTKPSYEAKLAEVPPDAPATRGRENAAGIGTVKPSRRGAALPAGSATNPFRESQSRAIHGQAPARLSGTVPLVDPVSHWEPPIDDEYPPPDYSMGIGCGDPVGWECEPGSNSCESYWTAGFAFTFLQPRFQNNPGFTVMEADGASFESFSEQQFDYGLELSPRVWVGRESCGGLGWQVTWWQFTNDPDGLSAQPPANGFGDITTPPFGAVDISSNIPTDTMSAASSLNAYTLDAEATQSAAVGCWRLGVGGGIRYACVEQTYLAQLRNSGDVLRGEIDYRHSQEGIGPTISLAAARPVTCQTNLFVRGRGSLLFGDSKTRLRGGEDLDLSTPFITTEATRTDDMLSIGELQVGFGWRAHKRCRQTWQPYATVALEGQIWNGPGNASTADGNLGFVGFTSGAGFSF